MQKVIAPLVVLVVVVIIAYTVIGSGEDYLLTIEKHRKEQSIFYKDADDSPFNQYNISFNGLNYFAPDPAYHVKATITPFERKLSTTLATSTGEKDQYLKFGIAHFKIDDVPTELLLLQSLDAPDKLFIAFTDATSANETYGAGRYIDLEYNGEKKLMIDFNKAYNPYCAFVDDYSCPLPPPENHLQVAILAGEKNYDN